MKLSKSKLALAKVINENGGWPIGADWSFQPKHDYGDVWFSSGSKKPIRSGDGFNHGCLDGKWIYNQRISHKSMIGNWNQCVLSREEYYHAYPKADDGWIAWGGGECPVDVELAVYVNYRDGGETPAAVKAGSQRWNHSGLGGDIMSYSLHKTEVKPELCESVTRSIPDPEAKPTIEQLAQDYRNKLGYANRKQQEADDAKAAADAALGELERAGDALGLLIGVAKPNPVIADWRDLMERDVIWFGGDDEQAAGEYSVLEVEHADYGGNRAIRIDTVGNDYWIDVTDDWKFIRRP